MAHLCSSQFLFSFVVLYEFFPDSSNVDPVILGVSVLLFVSYSMDIVYGVGFYNS